MPLVPIKNLLSKARTEGYAIGYFESWNLESLQGVVDAAEKTRSPIILGFNGEFLTHPGRADQENIKVWADMGKTLAEAASVPCGLIFNECPKDEAVFQAADAGFNLVMLADPAASPDQYTERVSKLTRYAHARGVAVEAELGELPSGVLADGDHQGSTTDPVAAAKFIESTGVDILSVSVGNVHIMIDGKKGLDFNLLREIAEKTGAALCLHGGTGIPNEDLQKVHAFGVLKVNFGTYLKQRYLQALRDALSTAEDNPHILLGMGGEQDILTIGRHAVRDAVLERIHFLGCTGRA